MLQLNGLGGTNLDGAPDILRRMVDYCKELRYEH